MAAGADPQPGFPLLRNPFPALSLAAALILTAALLGALVRTPGGSPVSRWSSAADRGRTYRVRLAALSRYLAQPASAAGPPR